MDPLKSQPHFSAWQVVLLLCLLVLTTLGQGILLWLFPQFSSLLNTSTVQIIIPLSCLGFMVLLFEQWEVIHLKPFFINSGLTMPLLASFALLYPLISYF